MNTLIRRVLRHPRLALAITLLAAFGVGACATMTQMDASIRAFLLSHDSDYELYRKYRTTFGQDEILVVAFECDDVFKAENLRLIGQLTTHFKSLDHIYDVRSLTNVEYMKSDGAMFEVKRLVGRIPADGGQALETAKKVALDNTIMLDDLVSRDARSTSILITLENVPGDYRYYDEIRAIESAVQEASARYGKRIHLAGERYLDYCIDGYIRSDIATFIPLTCLLLAALLWLFLRNVRETLIGMTAIVACLAFVSGIVPLSGWKVNAVLAGLPSLILCIAVTDVIHMLSKYKENRRKRVDDALQQTLRETIFPCFLTSFTTAIGFGSLSFNEILPIQGFGMLAALGVSACFPICIVTVATALKLWPGKEEEYAPAPAALGRAPGQRGSRFAGFVMAHARGIAIASCLVTVFCCWGLSRIELQTNRTDYLWANSPSRTSIDFIDGHLAGTTQLDIWIEGREKDAIKDPAVLEKIDRMCAYFREQPEISKVVSICDYIKDMHKAFEEDAPAAYCIPESREAVAQLLLIYSMSGNRNELDKYVNYGYSRTRISIRSNLHNSACTSALLAKMRGYLHANFRKPGAGEPRVTAEINARIATQALAENNVFHYLVRGLLSGLGLALLLCAATLGFAFGSVRVGLISMVPNLFPIVMTLGLMGWCGVDLDIATSMTFTIALGIAVDDTIHIISRYFQEGEPPSDVQVAGMMESLLKALVGTSIAIGSGFLVLTLSGLKMNALFGGLGAFIILSALAADLILTPLCLRFIPRSKERIGRLAGVTTELR